MQGGLQGGDTVAHVDGVPDVTRIRASYGVGTVGGLGVAGVVRGWVELGDGGSGAWLCIVAGPRVL